MCVQCLWGPGHFAINCRTLTAEFIGRPAPPFWMLIRGVNNLHALLTGRLNVNWGLVSSCVVHNHEVVRDVYTYSPAGYTGKGCEGLPATRTTQVRKTALTCSLPALLHFAWVIFWGGVWNHGKQSNKENPACWGRLCEEALLYMPIWAHHHAVPMCITIATMWMHNMQHHATLLGAKLDKAGANRKCRFADDPPHHSITYHYRITYTYQSRGHSLTNIEVHKMKVPKQTIGTLRAFGGLAGGLKCSWVRTWNIRRKQSILLHRIMTLGYTWSKFEECRRQLNCILFKTWEFENAWNALHTSAWRDQPMLNPRHAFFNYFSACAGASRSRSITGKFRSPGNIWKPKYLG